MLLLTRSTYVRMVQNLLVLPVPVNLLTLAEASRGHDYGHCVSEAGIDVAVRRLAIAHAFEPVVGVRFQIVALMQRRSFRVSRKCHGLRLHFSRWLGEDHIGLPPAT